MGTHYTGRKHEVTALNTYIKLIRAAESISARLNNKLIKEGLTESQFSVLESLLHLGPLCQKELGSKLLKSGGNITMVVDNLEKQGFVIRERDTNDRRYFKVNLTKQGKVLIEKLFPKHLGFIVEEIGILSEREQAELQRMCKSLGLKIPSKKTKAQPRHTGKKEIPK